jgi:multidrug efflux pump subunit AcrA (membrane-fusion protein)
LRKRGGELILGAILILIAGAAIVVMLKYFVQRDGLKARPLELPIPVQTLPAVVTSLHEVIGASGTIRSAVEQARLNLDHTTKQLQRMLTMQEKGFASAVEVENARTTNAAAQEALVQAEINLTNTRITAPAAAIVLERDINPGEIPSIGNQAFKLGIIEPVFMVAQVSEEKIGSVHMGMKGEASTDGFPGVAFTGEVVKYRRKGQRRDAHVWRLPQDPEPRFASDTGYYWLCEAREPADGAGHTRHGHHQSGWRQADRSLWWTRITALMYAKFDGDC